MYMYPCSIVCTPAQSQLPFILSQTNSEEQDVCLSGFDKLILSDIHECMNESATNECQILPKNLTHTILRFLCMHHSKCLLFLYFVRNQKYG